MTLAGAATTTVAAAAEGPDLSSLAHERGWLKLLHYRSDTFEGFGSPINVPGFFLSPRGAEDPEAELAAAVAAFRSGKPLLPGSDPDPRCVFPARFRWVSEHVPGSWTAVPCPHLDAWRAGLAATSATLVFSTAYAGNPASMFGHTFLRINAEPKGAAALDAQASGLLAYGISYGANVVDWNPLFYMYNGLTGGFQGGYNMAPYYMKVREYAADENRDLWEYDLGLSSTAVGRLVDHLWELLAFGGAPYYFLGENCSYQILAWIEAAEPDWDLTSQLEFPVAPAETVRKVADLPHGVTTVAFRPAERRRVAQAMAVLQGDERARLERVVDGDDAAGPGSGQYVLDAAIARLEFEKTAAKNEPPPELVARLRQVLAARAHTPSEAPRPLPPMDEGNRPDLGHAEHAIGAFAAWNGAAAYGLDGRVGYHDLLDGNAGHDRYFGLDYFGAELSYLPATHRVDVTRATILDATALAPFQGWDPQPAWKLAITASREPVERCVDCRHADMDGAVGLSTELAGQALLGYGLAGLGISYSDSYAGAPTTWTPALRAGVLANLWSRHKAQLEVVRRRPVSGDGALLAASTTITLEQAVFPTTSWRITNGLSWTAAGAQAVHARAEPSIRVGVERHF